MGILMFEWHTVCYKLPIALMFLLVRIPLPSCSRTGRVRGLRNCRRLVYLVRHVFILVFIRLTSSCCCIKTEREEWTIHRHTQTWVPTRFLSLFLSSQIIQDVYLGFKWGFRHDVIPAKIVGFIMA